jgi:Mu-like prophage tail protein gpP
VSEVALEIDGVDHQGWTAVEITKSMETLCGSFRLVLTSPPGKQGGLSPMNILPGVKAKVSIDGQALIDGYIDTVELAIEAERHEIRASGRDKTGDLVDCSVVNGTGEWKNLKLEALVTKLVEPFGITVKTEVDTGEAIPKFNVEQGMTVFEAVQKVCALRACLGISDESGNLVITRAGSEKSSTNIVEGENLLDGRATYDYTERFSEYVVKGQKQSKDNESADTTTKVKGVVKDANIERYRPMLLIADGQVDKAKADVRARWEAAVRRGRSRSYELTVQGWADSQGKIWKINRLLTLKAPSLGVNTELLTAEVTFTLDDGGELCKIKMLAPETYTPEPAEKISKGDTWQEDLKNLGEIEDNAS